MKTIYFKNYDLLTKNHINMILNRKLKIIFPNNGTFKMENGIKVQKDILKRIIFNEF